MVRHIVVWLAMFQAVRLAVQALLSVFLYLAVAARCTYCFSYSKLSFQARLGLVWTFFVFAPAWYAYETLGVGRHGGSFPRQEWREVVLGNTIGEDRLFPGHCAFGERPGCHD